MLYQYLLRMIKYILVTLLIGLRPLLGPAVCTYEIGCTQFAVTQLESLPLHKALWAIIKRLLACSPLSRIIS